MKNSLFLFKGETCNKSKQYLQLGLFLLFLSLISFRAVGALVITNGLTHEHSVVKGDTVFGAIIVTNTSSHSESFIVHQRDYYINHAGESDYPEAGSSSRSNASWIDYEPDNYTLQSGETTTVNYRIIVPDSIDFTGTYWSVILVEGTESPMNLENQGLVTINSIIRYAVQVICHFNGYGKKDIEFINVALTHEDERKILNIDLINSGDFMLRPIASIELFDAAGESLGIYKSIKKRVFPKTSRRFEIDLTKLKAGSYQSLLLADCSDEEVFGTNLTVEIKDE